MVPESGGKFRRNKTSGGSEARKFSRISIAFEVFTYTPPSWIFECIKAPAFSPIEKFARHVFFFHLACVAAETKADRRPTQPPCEEKRRAERRQWPYCRQWETSKT